MNLLHRYRIPLLPLVLGAALALPARDTPASEYSSAVSTTLLLRTTTDVAGTPLVYPAGTAEATGVLVELPPGAETGWHRHTAPCFAYILSGEIAVTQQNGPTRTFRAGEAFAELVNLEHNGRTVGDEPVRLVFFAAGTQGQPFTQRSGETQP